MNTAVNDDLVTKFATVVRGPDGDLLLNLLEILYDRIVEENFDDHYLSPEDIQAIQRGEDDLREGRSLTLAEYRSGKRL
jgi:hypothetical protein